MDKPRILIIDDDANLRQCLVNTLRCREYDAMAARNGVEGIALLKENLFNLVLIDLCLPDISGIDVLDRVKTDFPSTEAIILTGHATLDSAIAASNRGAFSYQLKPCDINQLMLQIKRAIEKQQVEAAARESREDLNHAQAVAQIGSWRMDVSRDELLWSDETHRMFGIPKGTPLTYEVFLAVVHPDDREFVDRSWQVALRGAPYAIEHRIIVAGAERWVREQAELEFSRQGVLLGGFGTAQDITERKRAEQERECLIQELQDALARVKMLSGMLPICAGCKKIRDDKGHWNQLEAYISEHSEVLFSHGFCPDCLKKAYEELEEVKKLKIKFE